jgi:Phasin protein
MRPTNFDANQGRKARRRSLYPSPSNDRERLVLQRATMEEEEDQRQFFKDLGATAEQTVEEVRGAEENYFVLLQRMFIAFPWLADITTKLQSYADQNFVNTLNFSYELDEAKDIEDFIRINVEFAQTSFKSVVEQAEDFREACTAWQRRQLRLFLAN